MKMYPKIKIKRVYEDPTPSDGLRILVDRLWPRGISKEKAAVDQWAKEITPSGPIRIEFGHMPERWKDFETKYLTELKNNELIDAYLEQWEDFPMITFVYAARDTQHTHAIILQKFIQNQYEKR